MIRDRFIHEASNLVVIRKEKGFTMGLQVNRKKKGRNVRSKEVKKILVDQSKQPIKSLFSCLELDSTSNTL
jgi:hypothetical protein